MKMVSQNELYSTVENMNSIKG